MHAGKTRPFPGARTAMPAEQIAKDAALPRCSCGNMASALHGYRECLTCAATRHEAQR